ncbi:uncharacterized protein [Pleurodeles waltl]|uniref:uncharacterized protein n=1 Tax=Pleurodeles waltl TaxID=8319 RepID=UPI0037098481
MFKKKLEEANKEMAEYKEMLMQSKIKKLQKDLKRFSKEKVYPYITDEYIKQKEAENNKGGSKGMRENETSSSRSESSDSEYRSQRREIGGILTVMKESLPFLDLEIKNKLESLSLKQPSHIEQHCEGAASPEPEWGPIEESKKRWYDLRSRAKERVARRLAEARGTGGGPPIEPPATPLEDLVESTLLPEAVTGVTDIDTSAQPSTSQGGPGPAATQIPCVGETDTQQPSDTNTSGSLNVSTVRRRPRPLPDLSGDSDVQQEGPSTPPAPDRRSQIPEDRGHAAQCRSATVSQQQPHEAGEGPSLFGGLEAAMLQQQHLQNRRILSLDRNLRVHNRHMMGLHR